MKKISKILSEKETFLFVKAEDNTSVYVRNTAVLGGIKEFYRLLNEGKAFAEVDKNEKGYYALALGSKKALNRAGYGDPADVAAAQAEAEARAAEKEAKQKAAYEAWKQAQEEENLRRKAAEQAVKERKEFLLSKVSKTNKVLETIVIHDSSSEDDGKETTKNYVFDKENMIKIIGRFSDNLNWDEEAQLYKIVQIWTDTQDWVEMRRVTNVATPLKTAEEKAAAERSAIVKELGYEPYDYGELELDEVCRVCNVLQISIAEFCEVVGLK